MPIGSADAHCLIVADGDVLVRNALADYLRHCGYKVIEAATSDEVVEVIEEGSATIDALLTDAELGGRRNPFELRMWMSQHHPEIVVLLAGNIDAAAKAAGQLCDEGPHLRRPYEPERVVAHIKRLLAAVRR